MLKKRGIWKTSLGRTLRRPRVSKYKAVTRKLMNMTQTMATGRRETYAQERNWRRIQGQ
jgi:hypothetical protein